MILDRIDRSLLRELSKRGRSSHIELSDRVGLSSTACARRLRTLEELGVIKRYSAILDLARLGLGTIVLVQITLDSQSEEALNAFEAAVANCASVMRCLLMSGSDDYLVTVVARDILDFERIHKTQLSRLPRVARIRSSFAIREVIDRALPPAVFNGEMPQH